MIVDESDKVPAVNHEGRRPESVKGNYAEVL
jgi:hypothetical protein